MIIFSSYKKNVACVWFQVVYGVCFTEKRIVNLPNVNIRKVKYIEPTNF